MSVSIRGTILSGIFLRTVTKLPFCIFRLLRSLITMRVPSLDARLGGITDSSENNRRQRTHRHVTGCRFQHRILSDAVNQHIDTPRPLRINGKLLVKAQVAHAEALYQDYSAERLQPGSHAFTRAFTHIHISLQTKVLACNHSHKLLVREVNKSHPVPWVTPCPQGRPRTAGQDARGPLSDIAPQHDPTMRDMQFTAPRGGRPECVRCDIPRHRPGTQAADPEPTPGTAAPRTTSGPRHPSGTPRRAPRRRPSPAAR